MEYTDVHSHFFGHAYCLSGVSTIFGLAIAIDFSGGEAAKFGTIKSYNYCVIYNISF